jgi:hypothetical protein
VSQGQIVKAFAHLKALNDEYLNTKTGAVYFVGRLYNGAHRRIYLSKGTPSV